MTCAHHLNLWVAMWFGSINIPLDELPLRLKEIADRKTIILCCASGMRSGNAAVFLKQNGVDCYNGGSWTEVNYQANNL